MTEYFLKILGLIFYITFLFCDFSVMTADKFVEACKLLRCQMRKLVDFFLGNGVRKGNKLICGKA